MQSVARNLLTPSFVALRSIQHPGIRVCGSFFVIARDMAKAENAERRSRILGSGVTGCRVWGIGVVCFGLGFWGLRPSRKHEAELLESIYNHRDTFSTPAGSNLSLL